LHNFDKFTNESARKGRASSGSPENRNKDKQLVSRDDGQEGGGSTHRKSKRAEKEMKRLVEKQQKDWVKKIKKEKMNDIIQQ
jgi:hypothetical protein